MSQIPPVLQPKRSCFRVLEELSKEIFALTQKVIFETTLEEPFNSYPRLASGLAVGERRG